MKTGKARRFLAIGHSFILALNRRLPAEIERASNGEWVAEIAAPRFFAGNKKFGQMRPERLSVSDREPVPVGGVPMAFTNRIHVSLYGWQLRSLMRKHFDLIHCWEEPYILSGGQLAAWAPRESALTYLTFQNISKTYPPPFSAVERFAMARTTGWIAGGATVAAALRDRPGYEKPHRVIGFGLDEEQFKPDRMLRDETLRQLQWDVDGAPVVGYLGRLTEAKGLRVFMESIDRVKEPLRILVIGSGDLEGEVLEWGAKRPASFRHIPHVGRDDVPRYLAAFNILCAPSQTTAVWREQFGRMIIEAFASGVPVIGSDSGEIPFVIADAGRVCPEADVALWAESISELASSQDARGRYRTLGLERVRKLYTWSAVGRQYAQFFEDMHALHARKRGAVFSA